MGCVAAMILLSAPGPFRPYCGFELGWGWAWGVWGLRVLGQGLAIEGQEGFSITRDQFTRPPDTP